MSTPKRPKAGGLAFNPLLTRTEPTAADDTGTRPPVDTSPGTEPATAPSEPVKFTFYFTPAQLERLDDAWTAFRRRARGTDRRLSKSLFVRVALDDLLDAFDRDPEAVVARLRGIDADKDS